MLLSTQDTKSNEEDHFKDPRDIDHKFCLFGQSVAIIVIITCTFIISAVLSIFRVVAVGIVAWYILIGVGVAGAVAVAVIVVTFLIISVFGNVV